MADAKLALASAMAKNPVNISDAAFSIFKIKATAATIGDLTTACYTASSGSTTAQEGCSTTLAKTPLPSLNANFRPSPSPNPSPNPNLNPNPNPDANRILNPNPTPNPNPNPNPNLNRIA